MNETVTEDKLVGGRVRLMQPVEGYRVAIDPVLLAAAVGVAARDRVLDAGCGTGAAALCLAARVPGCRVVGLELDVAMADLAERNAALNGFEDRIQVVRGSIGTPPALAASGGFEHVMTNPPYMADGTPPPAPGRAAAQREGDVGLQAWLQACHALLKPKGSLTIIHRADRLDAVLVALKPRFGGIAVLPLWPMAGRPAKRVLVRGVKGSGAPAALLPGLVLHRSDGQYTPEAEAILSGGQGLQL